MKKYFLLSFLFLISGCATLSGITDSAGISNIKIVDDQNNLLHGVQCQIFYRSKTLKFDSPNFSLSKNIYSHDYPSIFCKKDGYKTYQIQKLPKIANPNSIWNIFWLPGFALDAAAGNMTLLKENITIQMNKNY
jgi:hypothetical protein